MEYSLSFVTSYDTHRVVSLNMYITVTGRVHLLFLVMDLRIKASLEALSTFSAVYLYLSSFQRHPLPPFTLTD
jgi:hypothetical protein